MPKPFKCLACPKAFSTSWYLENHYIHHVLVKDPSLQFFSCAQCGKKFRKQAYVLMHLRSASHPVENKEISKSILIDADKEAHAKKLALEFKAQHARKQ